MYFSVDDPGRWKDFAKDHAPQVKVSGGKIEVEVPFTAEMGHYTEVIFIQDMAQREVALRTFKRGEKAHATLSIPLEKMPGAAVITKCNLHGMWKKSIVQ
ncbi:MAG TPA: desulfoferrodoxin family protein [Turneriella sp.]|nr:desulfoferrodoxin family protein [Turneriella sp.]